MTEPVICFSQAVNLRCIGLSHIQRITLVIAPALPLLAAFYLASLSLRRPQFKNALIFIETFVYFGLCAGDLAVHDALTPASQSSLHTYTVADRAIGALSGVSLVAFATFLPLFISSAVLPYLHRNWHMASIYILMLSAPIVLAFEELASLDGLKYSLSSSGAITQSYTSASAHRMADIFTKIAASTLVLVQLIVSLLCIRLTSHINHIHELGGSIPGITVRASVVFAAGAAIGALDSAFAFVPEPVFGTILFRRILYCLSRLLIIASLISQHHTELRTEASPESAMRSPVINTVTPPTRARHSRRRSGLLGLIGNPRYSTFAHLRGDNAMAADFSTAAAEQRRRQQQRVTVSYDRVNPPKLNVRFSQLGFPSTAVDRAFAHARASVGLGLGAGNMAGPRPTPMTFGSAASRAGLGMAEKGAAGPSSKPMLSPTISVRANASLYRHRPEYFQSPSQRSQPSLPLPVSVPQSQQSGRRSSVRESASNFMGALARGLSVRHASFSSRVSPRDSGLSSGNDDSYDRKNILAQFPDTPRTGSGSGMHMLLGRSQNGSIAPPLQRFSEEEDEKSTPRMPEPIHYGTPPPRSRAQSSRPGTADPFLDMSTSTDASSGRILSAEIRRVAGVPIIVGGEERNVRDSFLDLDDHPPTPFDPNGYAAGAPVAAENPFGSEPRPSQSSFSHSRSSSSQSSSSSNAPRPSDVSSTASHLAPSHPRLDMRHQRLPTADLAPLDVFRERLAERRRERSAHSGSSGSALTGSLSPPSRNRTLSRSRRDEEAIMEDEDDQGAQGDVGLVRDALNNMGNSVRNTVATVSTVASFFIGEPPVPVTDTDTSANTNTLHPQRAGNTSRWSETNESDVLHQAQEQEPDSRASEGESILAPPSMGQLSRVDSERTTPSPDRVPSQIRHQEQRGSVGFEPSYGYAQ